MSGTLTRKISTVSKDGRPHVAPIWFTLDNGDSNINVIFTTYHDSVKADNYSARLSGAWSYCDCYLWFMDNHLF